MSIGPIAQHAARQPDRPALVAESRSIAWRELCALQARRGGLLALDLHRDRPPTNVSSGCRRGRFPVSPYLVVASSIIASVLAWTGPVSAGWIIDWGVKGSSAAVQRELLHANRMKILISGKDGTPAVAFIVDLDANTFTQVYYEKRYYITDTVPEYVLTMGAMAKMAMGLWPAAPDLVEALKQAAPDQRKKMEEELKLYEQQMRASGWGQPEPACREPRIETRKVDQRDTIAGHAAVRYDVLADGKPSGTLSEIWVAKSLPAWQELDPQKFQRFLAEIAKTPCGAGGSPHEVLSHAAWRLRSEGYPVRKALRAAKGGGEVEVIRVETREIPLAELEPPPGFVRKTFWEHIR